jgi:hypothetical protein
MVSGIKDWGVSLQGDVRRAQRAAEIMREEAETLRRQAEGRGSRVAQQEEQLGERETQMALKAASVAAAQKVRGGQCLRRAVMLHDTHMLHVCRSCSAGQRQRPSAGGSRAWY